MGVHFIMQGSFVKGVVFFQNGGVNFMSILKKNSYPAFIVSGLFFIRFVFFFLPHSISGWVQNGTLFGAILAIAEHMIMFPVIAALRAPQWSKAAGYGWLVIDMATDIMALNGVDSSIYISLSYRGHISAATWFASSSWSYRGAIRIFGVLTALNLGVY